MAGALGRDHHDVVAGAGCHTAVEDVEAMGEEDRRIPLEVRLDVLFEDRGLHLVGQQQRHELRAAHGVRDRSAPRVRPPPRRPTSVDPSRSPTTTRTPESWRFSAWAWPWLP